MKAYWFRGEGEYLKEVISFHWFCTPQQITHAWGIKTEIPDFLEGALAFSTTVCFVVHLLSNI